MVTLSLDFRFLKLLANWRAMVKQVGLGLFECTMKENPMVNTEFANFLKQKKEREAQGSHVDWERRKSIWLGKIDALYREVESWLAPYKTSENNEKLLETVTESIKIHEERLGTYPVPTMRIRISSEDVNLVPKGLVILGGLGRVDMTGPLGSVMIILNDTDQPPTVKTTISTSTSETAHVSHPRDKPTGPSIEERMGNSGWYFVPPDRRGTMLQQVTEESFTKMLISMVRS